MLTKEGMQRLMQVCFVNSSVYSSLLDFFTFLFGLGHLIVFPFNCIVGYKMLDEFK